MHGYVYKVYQNTSPYSFLGWWPYAVTSASTEAKLTYTLVRCDTSYVTTQIEENTSITNSIEVYPNPGKTEQSIKLNLSDPAEVTIQLIDYTGRLVETVYSGHVYDREFIVKSEIVNLTNGMYLIKYLLEMKFNMLNLLRNRQLNAGKK